MQKNTNKLLCSYHGCWDCLVPLLKREHTTNLAELLKLTTVVEQSLRGSVVDYRDLKSENLQVV